MKIVFLTFFFLYGLNLFAYNDNDLDGVEDALDQCPDTPFSELVDLSGCSKTQKKSVGHFNIIVGINFSQTNYDTMENTDTTTGSLQIDYYYKNITVQASSSYYNSSSVTYNDSGVNDSFIGAYYQFFPADKFTLRLGAGAILPTYNSSLNNNNTDYTLSATLSYMIQDINYFGGYTYTLINDSNLDSSVLYQNTSSYNAGIGFYPLQKLYLSASYTSSQSIYSNIESLDTLSMYAFYALNKHWFTNLNYAYGISDTASDNFLALRLGYYF